MTEDIFVRARQNCCRLCLAPDSECVPILTSLAADKEPISTKIQACVNVKVSQSDRLSLRICHSCISFMNSWQSFKNRCLAAQMKQMNWLEMARNSMRRQAANVQLQPKQLPSIFQPQQNATQDKPNQNRPQNKPVTGRPMPMPIIIKEEPIDEEADAQEEAAMRLNLDPTQFLDENIVPKQEVEEKEDESQHLESNRQMNEDPQILTSLGLTQIRKLNPYSQLNPTAERKRPRENQEITSEVLATQCRYCHMMFASATNARRHERNIHRASETNNVEPPPKFCIKPTTPRSLLKPLHSLRSNIKPTHKVAPPPVTPEMMGIYEYDRPEKYRHLITDSKLMFIRKNEDFLKQYQTLTCTCCPQTFPSYKTFMAHMRRKFPNLARNLCFKCLKQFQSKATFVAHLKKRNCINLYQLYKTDDAIPKTGSLPFSSEKVGTKELLSNKVYECKLCSKSFRLKLDFRSHVYEAHGDRIRNVPPTRCAFCSAELDDPLVKRRHYNNMECVVLLRCSICQEKFDFQQQFINHVYEMHMTGANNNDISGEASDATPMDVSSGANVGLSDSINSRLPHSCNICGQTYNNYYNVLRHMEGKHPDQVPKRYTCEKCNAGFPRQGPLREHMYEVHGTTLPRARREMLSCRMCSEQIETREKWLTHQGEKHSRYTCCFCTFQSKSLDKFKDHIETHPQLSLRNVPVPVVSDANVMSVTNGGNEGDDEDDENLKPAKRIKLETSLYTCTVCNASFSGNVALSNHLRTHYTADAPGVSDNKANITETTPQITSTPNLPTSSESIRRIRCHLCSKRFTSKKTYRKHMLNEHQVRNVSFIKCTVCKAEFTHERGLRVHMYKSHGTILTNEAVNAIYECEICDAEFKSEKSLNQHKGMVHKNREKDEPVEVTVQTVQNGPIYWHQCNYCSLSFDSNKKLAVHLNSHEEFDANDYSCKDCGNVYNGRKSLWVHRYKKHRETRNPCSCPICNKLFLTTRALKLHMKNGHDKEDDEIENTENFQFVGKGKGELYNEEDREEDQEEEEEEEDEEDQDEERNMENDNDAQEGLSLLEGKVHCSVCNEEFTDQDLFDKHMETHQVDLYSDNPLAAMFDTGPADPNEYFINRMSENGAYTCDICPKSFPALTALKVHRNWHFRQDSKQVPADSSMRSMAQKKKAGNVCEFCDTAFSSASNLRRHIIEVHNRKNTNNPDRAKKFMDKYLECTKCKIKFDGKSEWVKHKIGHANESFISAFEWGCEICGRIVSRKERLVQHMNSHLKKRERDDGTGSVMSEEHSNSQDTVLSSNQSRRLVGGKPRTGEDDDGEVDDEDRANAVSREETKRDEALESRGENDEEVEESINGGNDENESDDEEEIENDDDDEHDEKAADKRNVAGNNHLQFDDDSSQQYQEVDPDQDDIQDEDEEEEEEEAEEEEEQDNIGAYSCDLCQVYFETSKQLRRHVTSHFLNGPGSVTLTQIPKDKSSYGAKVGTADDAATLTPA